MSLTQRLILLAIDMDDLAGEIRDQGEEGPKHAAEMEGAARMVRQWAQSLVGEGQV